MAKRGYTLIPDWMLDLDLDIYETIILSVIYGFSQDGDSLFQGSQKFLQWKARCSRTKVVKALGVLLDKGLIEKIDKVVNGVKLCDYRVSLWVTGCTQEVQGCTPQVQGGCTPQVHQNNIVEKKEENNNKEREKRFVKPTINEIAEYCRERQNTIDPEAFFAFYESKGWRIGNTPMKNWKSAIITWEKKRASSPSPSPRRQESAFQSTMNLIRKLNNGGIDEQ